MNVLLNWLMKIIVMGCPTLDGCRERGVMQGSFYKVTITRKSGQKLAQKCDYVISEYEKRIFNHNMYLHPIFENEINKGYMIQNPGW